MQIWLYSHVSALPVCWEQAVAAQPSTGHDVCSHQINCKEEGASLLACVLFGILETAVMCMDGTE